ncbi:MAG TPA: hypothetical protein VGY57_00540, partial [Vicinamibacterales bacterium]|nr:hypothetical protein [Vicinamibacterales bacterium]
MCLMVVARPVSAHPVPFSYLDLRVQRDAIDGTLVVHIIDAAHDLRVEPPERLLQPPEATRAFAALTRMLGDRFSVA